MAHALAAKRRKKCSPRRKPWERSMKEEFSPKGAKGTVERSRWPAAKLICTRFRHGRSYKCHLDSNLGTSQLIEKR